MKYAKETYEQTEFYGADEAISDHVQKIAKVRLKHTCYNCQKVIEVGENALVERCFMDGQPQSAYTCIGCCDKWLDDIGRANHD